MKALSLHIERNHEFLVVLIFFFLKTCLGNSKGGEKNLKLPDKKTFQEEKKKKKISYTG